MNTIPFSRRPRIPDVSETELAKQSARYLASHVPLDTPVRVRIDDETETVSLPASATRLLLDILTQMAQGNAVTLVPIHAELTTQQAANLLNVSRPYLIGLLERGKIAYHLVGTHRRIRAEDLFAYRDKQRAQADAALDEMVAISQDLGLGYD